MYGISRAHFDGISRTQHGRSREPRDIPYKPHGKSRRCVWWFFTGSRLPRDIPSLNSRDIPHKRTVRKKEGSDRVLNPVELARHQVLNCSRGNRLEWDSNLLGLKVRRMLLIYKPNTTTHIPCAWSFSFVFRRAGQWGRAPSDDQVREP